MELRREHGGFTQVELVVVIAVAGILAAVAIPRFVTRDAFDSRDFYDLAITGIRFAQKAAIARRAKITVCVSSTEVRVISNTNCGSPVTLTHPTTGAPLVATAPSGVQLTTVNCPNLVAGSFDFDGQGRTSAGTVIKFCSTIPGDPSRQVVVENDTGYVH
jgi:MSHA pilin protein MshC